MKPIGEFLKIRVPTEVKRTKLFEDSNFDLLKENKCPFCGHRLYEKLDKSGRYCKSIICLSKQGKRFFQRLK